MATQLFALFGSSLGNSWPSLTDPPQSRSAPGAFPCRVSPVQWRVSAQDSPDAAATAHVPPCLSHAGHWMATLERRDPAYGQCGAFTQVPVGVSAVDVVAPDEARRIKQLFDSACGIDTLHKVRAVLKACGESPSRAEVTPFLLHYVQLCS